MSTSNFKERVRYKKLHSKMTSAEKAARIIKDGMNIGIGTGITNSTPKTFFVALAKVLKGKGKISLFTGGPVPNEVDGVIAEADICGRRFGQFNNPLLLKKANNRSIPVIDTRTGTTPHKVKDGRYGKIDMAVVEATAINEKGYIIPSTSCLDSPSYLALADKIIIEINNDVPEQIEGIHDIYIPDIPPRRKPIPLEKVNDRIGTPYIKIDPEKIVAIIQSEIPDNPPQKAKVNEDSKKIANYLIEFLSNEIKSERMPENLLPFQFGIGNIPEALTAALSESDFKNIEIFSGTVGDGALDLIDNGKVTAISTGSLYLSEEGFKRFYKNIEKYKKYIIIRPIVLSDCPELISRVGSIAINGAIEVDIYGHANSSHIMGSRLISGVGGSCDYLWNSFLSIIVLPSIAKNGAISSIVPMVSHVDHPEHAIDVVITEQGIADLRNLAPVERANSIIENCSHPEYKDELTEYLNDALKYTGGHEPHMLERAFSFHIEFQKSGTMKKSLSK